MAMNGSNMVCWDTAPCSLVGRYPTMEETCLQFLERIFFEILTLYTTALFCIEGIQKVKFSVPTPRRVTGGVDV
jgi:hypothetical protein